MAKSKGEKPKAAPAAPKIVKPKVNREARHKREQQKKARKAMRVERGTARVNRRRAEGVEQRWQERQQEAA